MRSPHRWQRHHTELYDFCTVCGLIKRRVVIKVPGVNPARHGYRVTQYSWDGGVNWRWIRTRQPVPPCQGVYL